MKLPIWARVLGGVVGACLVAYGAYGLILRATSSRENAIIVSAILLGWAVVYLIWGRKLTAVVRRMFPADGP
jgi:hypothetical protein